MRLYKGVKLRNSSAGIKKSLKYNPLAHFLRGIFELPLKKWATGGCFPL